MGFNLPVIDLERDTAASALCSACETPGFFYLANHAVPEPLRQATRQCQSEFFALPAEQKLELHFEKAQRQRGYIPLGAESSDPKGLGDAKEALDFTFPVPPRDVSDPVAYRMYGPNLWPETLPGFRSTVEAYFGEMIRLSRALFQLIALGLELPSNYFDDKTDRPIAQLRLLHYPPRAGPVDVRRLGIGAHCDYECFTILDPGEVAGLQIQTRGDAEWLDVPAVPGTFVVNLGEMLARWTNDRFVATPHRVVNPSGAERYSIPFFFGTNYDATIECLPTCCSVERPARYRSIRAGEYLAKRLNEVYGSLPGS